MTDSPAASAAGLRFSGPPIDMDMTEAVPDQTRKSRLADALDTTEHKTQDVVAPPTQTRQSDGD